MTRGEGFIKTGFLLFLNTIINKSITYSKTQVQYLSAHNPTQSTISFRSTVPFSYNAIQIGANASRRKRTSEASAPTIIQNTVQHTTHRVPSTERPAPTIEHRTQITYPVGSNFSMSSVFYFRIHSCHYHLLHLYCSNYHPPSCRLLSRRTIMVLVSR